MLQVSYTYFKEIMVVSAPYCTPLEGSSDQVIQGGEGLPGQGYSEGGYQVACVGG